MNRYQKEAYYRDCITRKNGHWYGRGTNLARRVRDALWEVHEAQRYLNSLSHPEEKYRAALEEYHEVLEEHTDRIIDCQMRLDELQAQLSKPWPEYANSHVMSKIKQHPIANECARLDREIESSRRHIKYHKKRLEEQKEVLDNFPGLKSKADRDLEAARLNFEAERRTQDRIIEELKAKAEKSRSRPRKPIPQVKVRKDGDNYILEGLKEFFRAGARGLTVISERGRLSIPRDRIYPALRTLEGFTVRFNGLLEVCHASGYLRYTFPEHPDSRWYDQEIHLAQKEE
jgi:hypothetical protein